jgi:C4-type Zn-finger protein
MKKKLINLSEHNSQASSAQWAMINNSPRLNGIACPKCGEELYDSHPMMTLTSIPPQKNVACSKCDYVGYRVV